MPWKIDEGLVQEALLGKSVKTQALVGQSNIIAYTDVFNMFSSKKSHSSGDSQKRGGIVTELTEKLAKLESLTIPPDPNRIRCSKAAGREEFAK